MGPQISRIPAQICPSTGTHSLSRFARRKCMSSHLLLRTDTNGRQDNQFSTARYSQGSRLIHWVASWVFAFGDDNISLASSVQSTQIVRWYWDNFPYAICRCQMRLSSFPLRLILSHSLWSFSHLFWRPLSRGQNFNNVWSNWFYLFNVNIFNIVAHLKLSRSKHIRFSILLKY